MASIEGRAGAGDGGDGESASLTSTDVPTDVPTVLGLVRAAARFYPWAPRSLGARRGPRPCPPPPWGSSMGFM